MVITLFKECPTGQTKYTPFSVLITLKFLQCNISSNIPSHRLQEPFSGCYRSLKDSIIEALSSKVNKY